MFFVPTERFPALQSSRLKQAALKTVARREKPQRNLGLFHSGEYEERTNGLLPNAGLEGDYRNPFLRHLSTPSSLIDLIWLLAGASDAGVE